MIALKDSLGSDFVERVRAFFSQNGPLSKAKNFEFRPQQQEMAAAVARALEEERHLVVEAGNWRGQIPGLSRAGDFVGNRAEQKGDRLDSHD